MILVDNYVKSTTGYHCRMSNLLVGQVLWTLDSDKHIFQTRVVTHQSIESKFVVNLRLETEFMEREFLFLPSDLVFVKEDSWVPVANLEVGDSLEFINREVDEDFCTVKAIEFIKDPSRGFKLYCYPEDSFLCTPLGLWFKSEHGRK